MDPLLMVVGIAGTVFFLLRAAQMRTQYRSMSQLEAKRVELEAERARAAQPTLRERVWAWVYSLGYDGEVFPFAAALAFLYLTVATGLQVLSVAPTVAYVAALPASALVIYGAAKAIASRKRKRFNAQLVELLEMVAGQIEGGTGAQRALTMVVPTLADPLRSEMLRVLDQQVATKDLVGAMRDLYERYPSRAFALFISALEIDQEAGHAIAPAIRQAAGLLNADFQLRAEAVAEVAQQRGEFFIILAVMGAMAGYLLITADETRMAAYTSPVGLIAIAASLGNVVWGVWRILTMLRKLAGDEEL